VVVERRLDRLLVDAGQYKPKDAQELDNGLDPGYYAVFMVKASDPTVVIRVIRSEDDLGGHVNHRCSARTAGASP
jgi:hypothetical protein